MSNALIATLWGYEDIVSDGNYGYAGKILRIKPQHRTSIHKHNKKHETLIVREGLILVELGQGDRTVQFWLEFNQRVVIPPGTWHRLSAFRESEVFEISNAVPNKDIERESFGGKMSDDEFRALLNDFMADKNSNTIITVDVARAIAEQLHKQGRKIGFCNGCFDLVHLGHIELLRQARLRCDMLFVGVNDDLSIKKLKGESRPFVPAQGRFGLISSCRFVDYVVIAEETTCLNLVEAIKPDVYITTDEYHKTGPEARWMIAQGKPVEVIERIPGFNTTQTATLVHGRKPEKA